MSRSTPLINSLTEAQVRVGRAVTISVVLVFFRRPDWVHVSWFPLYTAFAVPAVVSRAVSRYRYCDPRATDRLRGATTGIVADAGFLQDREADP